MLTTMLYLPDTASDHFSSRSNSSPPVAITEAGGGGGQEILLDVVPADVVAGVGVTVTDDIESRTK